MVKKTTFLKRFLYIRVSYSVNSISLNLISEHYKPSSVSRVDTYTIHIKNISIFFCFSSNLWPLENFNRLIAKMLCKMKKKVEKIVYHHCLAFLQVNYIILFLFDWMWTILCWIFSFEIKKKNKNQKNENSNK